MNVFGMFNTITNIGGVGGNLSVVNGTLNVGAPVPDPATFPVPATLTVTTGSFNVGALTPDLPGGAGTVNLYPATSAMMGAPANALTVKGGTVNMYGGPFVTSIMSTAPVTLNGGTLNVLGFVPPPGATFGNMVLGDVINGGTINDGGAGLDITGSLTNSGTIQFGGVLQMLTIGGFYLQTNTGELDVRLMNGSLSDSLAVGGTATLNGGTLRVIALNPLAGPGQPWAIIDAGIGVGDFTPTAKIFPQDGGAWQGAFLAGTGVYLVNN
jgi:hypothetical protein